MRVTGCIQTVPVNAPISTERLNVLLEGAAKIDSIMEIEIKTKMRTGGWKIALVWKVGRT